MEEIAKDEALKVLERIELGLKEMPPQPRAVCEFLLKNHDRAALMSVKEVAEACGTSPATVVRAATLLGFDGYRELKEALKRLLIKGKKGVWWQFEEALESGPSESPRERLLKVLFEDAEAIRASATELLSQEFPKACQMMERARQIAVFATRTTKPAALYLHIMLNQFLHNVFLLGNLHADEIFDDLVDLNEHDLLVAISTAGPHYARLTIEAVEFARGKGIPSILITTELSHPAAPSASVVLPVSAPTGHHSLVPVLSLLDALIVELTARKKNAARRKLKTLEALLVEKQIDI